MHLEDHPLGRTKRGAAWPTLGDMKQLPNFPGPRAARLTTLAGVVLVSLCTWSGLSASTAAAASPPAHVATTQALTRLLFAHGAHRSPSASSSLVASVPAQTPITEVQTTLPVIGRATDREGHTWLRVMLPGRPNGLTGWIAAGGTREVSTLWHMFVNLAGRRIWIYRDGQMVQTYSADVGNASTPTPVGQFFV